MSDRQAPSRRSTDRAIFTASVSGVGFARLDAPELAAFRRRPGPVPEGWKQPAATLLKASDEQSVAAVAAVFAALASESGAAREEYVGWGAVVASRFLGRSQLVVALDRFRQEGVWGVSPHLIPHFALHSPSGTLSLALGLHGPNLGVGGGADAAIQGFLTALTWLDEGKLPGVWLVLTGHTPELVPGPKGEPTTESRCEALALALTPDGSGRLRGPRVRLTRCEDGTPGRQPDLASLGERVRSRLAAKSALPSIYRPHIAPAAEDPTIATDPTMGLTLEFVDRGSPARGGA